MAGAQGELRMAADKPVENEQGGHALLSVEIEVAEGRYASFGPLLQVR